MTMELAHKLERIRTRSDLVDFLRSLNLELEAQREDWRNRGTDDYLDALSAWLAESDRYYAFRGLPPLGPQLGWREVGEMLLAATQYE